MEHKFIDMHMHSTYSNEECARYTPQIILNKVSSLLLPEETACVSITDHNSILANPVALKFIKDNPNLKNIFYITGGEFNTGTKSLGKYSKGGTEQAIFKKLHMLGYNFDPYDPELSAFSKVFEMKIGNVNLGQQIIASRNVIKHETGLNIKFTDLLPLVSMNRLETNYYVAFNNIILNKAKEQGLDITLGSIMRMTGLYFGASLNYNDLAVTKSKPDILELSKLIHDAGGKCVIAHPFTLTYKNQKLPENMNALDEFILKANENGRNIDGIELFSPTAYFSRRNIVKLYYAAEKHDLFLTAGSDYHGFSAHSKHLIGQVFDHGTLSRKSKDYGAQHEYFHTSQTKNHVVNLAIVNEIATGRPAKNKQDFKIINQDIGEIKKAESIARIITNDQDKIRKDKDENITKEHREKAKKFSRVSSETYGKGETVEVVKDLETIKKENLHMSLRTLTNVIKRYNEVLYSDNPETFAHKNLILIKSFLNVGFDAIKTTNLEFFDVQYISNHEGDFINFISRIEKIKQKAVEFSAKCPHLADDNKEIISAFEGIKVNKEQFDILEN